MPTYEYDCPTHGVFEEVHSIKIKLEHCPQCKEDGKETPVKRLISLGGKGVVELTGAELVSKVKADAAQLKKEAAKSEKVYSSLLGEDKYQSLQTSIDRRKREKY